MGSSTGIHDLLRSPRPFLMQPRQIERSKNESSRRGFLEAVAAGAGLASATLLAGCHTEVARETEGGRKKLRAAFSNAGLQSSWCALGKTTAELWGKLLDVGFEWID